MVKITLGTAQGQLVGWVSAPGGNMGQGRQKCGLRRRRVTCRHRPAAGEPGARRGARDGNTRVLKSETSGFERGQTRLLGVGLSRGQMQQENPSKSSEAAGVGRLGCPRPGESLRTCDVPDSVSCIGADGPVGSLLCSARSFPSLPQLGFLQTSHTAAYRVDL